MKFECYRFGPDLGVFFLQCRFWHKKMKQDYPSSRATEFYEPEVKSCPHLAIKNHLPPADAIVTF